VSHEPFEQLVEDHGVVVWRICASMVGPADAEDVWSDTFLAALRAYDRLEEGSNPAAWLTTIAQNRCLDELRRRDRRRRVAERVTTAMAAEPVLVPGELLDTGMATLVADLPDRQRLAVAFRYLADLSYPQVAARIGCSVPAARRSASDGIASLRRRLATTPPEEHDGHP
jgi:RNA polymerase sigma factor (sigma-70 family)